MADAAVIAQVRALGGYALDPAVLTDDEVAAWYQYQKEQEEAEL